MKGTISLYIAMRPDWHVSFVSSFIGETLPDAVMLARAIRQVFGCHVWIADLTQEAHQGAAPAASQSARHPGEFARRA